jgi:hypothetical protein
MKGALQSKGVSQWMGRALAMVASVCILTWLGSLVVIYLADEYASPAWDEQSVPPPSTH